MSSSSQQSLCVITGGTRGLGRAIALEFAEKNYHVIATYVRQQSAAQALQSHADKLNLNITTVRADVSTDRGRETLLQSVVDSQKKLNVLVHSAATGVHKLLMECSERELNWTFNTNTFGFLRLIQTLLPQFEKSGNQSIVAISSNGAHSVLPAYGLVGASKAALECWIRYLAVELSASHGIRVNGIRPGTLNTEAWDHLPQREERIRQASQRAVTGRLVNLSEVAQLAYFLCSDNAQSITGEIVPLNGGGLLMGS
ncbi:MAG: SDR family oxidoreductase [Pseudomonadota bacterium]